MNKTCLRGIRLLACIFAALQLASCSSAGTRTAPLPIVQPTVQPSPESTSESTPGPTPSPEPMPEPTPTPEPASEPAPEATVMPVALPTVESAPTPGPSPTPESMPSAPPAKTRPNAAVVYTPSSPGTTTYSGGGATLDASNSAQGYVTVQYSGSNQKVKLQITKQGGTTYTYDIIKRGSYEVFPLTEGNGSYTVNVFENIGGTSYAQALGETITVSLQSGLLPFLYPNQFVGFTASSAAVKQGETLAEGMADDLGVVAAVYNYVIKNVSYDAKTAEAVTAGKITSYIPSVDGTLSSRTGICFDYASLMAAMLRSQNIPTRLEVGYAGSIYHAWLSTYITDIGWVNGVIYFDGKTWKLMDPTFASSGNGNAEIMRFIGNGANYNKKFVY